MPIHTIHTYIPDISNTTTKIYTHTYKLHRGALVGKQIQIDNLYDTYIYIYTEKRVPQSALLNTDTIVKR